MSETTPQTTVLGDIPINWVEPDATAAPRRLDDVGQRIAVIWLTGFGGDRHRITPYLHRLAEAGFIGVTFDPWQHGDRMLHDVDELRARIRGNIRKHFWPILTYTAEETPKVIDWAMRELGASARVGMGGISMGGDIAVAAAGVDPRIHAVVAGIATPDWLRPGSFEPPGEPDAAAQACYDRRNPLTHLHLYAHTPAIAFESGDEDGQVPPDGGERFRDALLTDLYADCPHRLRVTRHAGAGHQFTQAFWDHGLDWFTRWLTTQT